MSLRNLCCVFFLMSVAVPQGMAIGQENATDDEINLFYQEVILSLASQPSPTFPVEAEALIAFTVSDDGTIDTINVAQSSGSNPLDDAALDIVQKAAPFPAPPAGAKRNLSITIKSTRPVLTFGNLDDSSQ